MRIAVVSDIHGNLAALEAVMAHAEKQGPIDGVWNTGDAVGYGPQPSECIARLRSDGALWVAGNHERAATGAIDTSEFNPIAAEAAEWTKGQLSKAERRYLDDLPQTVTENNFVFVHGSLRWPIWEYLDDEDTALAHLTLMRAPFSIVGHTHIPLAVYEEPSSAKGVRLVNLPNGCILTLDPATKTVLNPGSVGQPRDGDRRASYAIYDSSDETFTLHRVEYDISLTQRLMIEVDLPPWLHERLGRGR